MIRKVPTLLLYKRVGTAIEEGWHPLRLVGISFYFDQRNSEINYSQLNYFIVFCFMDQNIRNNDAFRLNTSDAND